MRALSGHRMLACAFGAGLSLAWASGPAAAQSAADRELGRYLAGECVTCHQASGADKGIPAIVGWPPESFIAAMNEYRDRKRANPVMQTVAGKLGAEQLAALAAYFGSLPPSR